MSDYLHTDFDFEKLPKLIRDKIPEIILKKEGKKALTRVLEHDEFILYLKRKLVEEALETLNTNHEDRVEFMREIADILEILAALQQELNLTDEEIATIRQEKAEKNGAFAEKLLFIGKE
ncbi:MAG: hypothetical protein OHK0017_11920 [Patescibacteria group bacterium]